MIPPLEELRRLRTQIQAATEYLKLPFRKHVWRGQTGDFSGGGTGSSLDFQDHRNYMPGDDPRHINWQAYARTGNYSMKLYREEVRPLTDIIFDVSDSMFYTPEKARRSVELFYFLIESVHRDGASAVCYLVKGQSHIRLSDEAVHADVWPDEAAKLTPLDPRGAPAIGNLPLRGNAMRIFVSDLLFAATPTPITAALSTRQGRGMILSPFAAEESNPDWHGNYEFIDPEDNTHHMRRVEPTLLKRYLTAYTQHFEYWKTVSRKHGVILARVPARNDFQQAMQLEALKAGAVEMMA
jgi:uncharacterized protein (DUF58 family)